MIRIIILTKTSACPRNSSKHPGRQDNDFGYSRKFLELLNSEKSVRTDIMCSHIATKHCQDSRCHHCYGCRSDCRAGHAQRADGAERPLFRDVSVFSRGNNLGWVLIQYADKSR